MYGKLFERMYTGSMMGSGAMMFAVWPYVIAHMKPNRDRTIFTVELNTQLMAILIGEKEDDISDIVQKCCEPDEKSRTPEKEGRKLIKLGAYLYEVVNGAVYDQIRREAELREANRRRQEKHYQKVKGALAGNGGTDKKETSDESQEVAIRLLPKNLQTERMKQKWDQWQQVRRDMKKCKNFPAMFNEQVEFLSKMTEPVAFETLCQSIRNGWQGLFDPSIKTKTTKNESSVVGGRF